MPFYADTRFFLSYTAEKQQHNYQCMIIVAILHRTTNNGQQPCVPKRRTQPIKSVLQGLVQDTLLRTLHHTLIIILLKQSAALKMQIHLCCEFVSLISHCQAYECDLLIQTEALSRTICIRRVTAYG